MSPFVLLVCPSHVSGDVGWSELLYDLFTESAVPGRSLMFESLEHCIRTRSKPLKVVDCPLDQVNGFFLQVEIQRVARHAVLKFVSWIVHPVSKNFWIAGATKHCLIEVALILHLFIKGINAATILHEFSKYLFRGACQGNSWQWLLRAKQLDRLYELFLGNLELSQSHETPTSIRITPILAWVHIPSSGLQIPNYPLLLQINPRFWR